MQLPQFSSNTLLAAIIAVFVIAASLVAPFVSAIFGDDPIPAERILVLLQAFAQHVPHKD